MSIIRSIFGPRPVNSAPLDPQHPVTPRTIRALISAVDGDQRIVVQDVTAPPWRPLCCLHLQFSDGSAGVGTGILIGPDVILTAAHNLYALDLRAFVKGGIAEVGVKNGVPAAQARIIHADICPGYTNRGPQDAARHKNDYAVARVDSDALYTWAGEYVKLTEQEPISRADLLRSVLNVAGYPDHEGPITLKTDSGSILANTLTNSNFSYTMDTMPGESGCPVFRYQADSKTFLLAGVHVAGYANANVARRYDAEMQSRIRTWLRA